MNEVVTPASRSAAANEGEVALVVQPVVLGGGTSVRKAAQIVVSSAERHLMSADRLVRSGTAARVVVKPGGRLSLQMHHHRAEHWIVVRGTARVTCGADTFPLCENESTYIPPGVTHRIENPGMTAREIVEVQSGAYPGEDDIVRFDDQYGRAQS